LIYYINAVQLILFCVTLTVLRGRY